LVPFTERSSVAADSAPADGCCATAGPVEATASTNNAATTRLEQRSIELSPLSCIRRPFDHAHTFRAGDHSCVRNPDEQAVLHHTGDRVEAIGEHVGMRNPLECCVKNPVPAIRDENVAIFAAPEACRPGAADLGGGGLNPAPGGSEAERRHLDGQWEAAQHRDPLRLVGYNDHARGSAGDNLFA